MKSIGIITVQKSEVSLIKKLFCPAELADEFGERPHFAVAAIPSHCGGRWRKRSIKAARRLLEKRGADFIVFDRLCESEASCDECKIKPPRIFDAYAFAYKRFAKNRVLNRVDIFDRKLDAVTGQRLCEIAKGVRNIYLHTEKITEFEKEAEEIFSEYGLWIECDDCMKSTDKKDALIDVDRGFVRIGDFLIDGVVYSCDGLKYDISIEEIVDKLGSDDCFEIKSWKSGKNMLEIS